MEDFCPLCLKKGIKNEIKLFQINLEEGVWLCKDEEVNLFSIYKSSKYKYSISFIINT